MREELFGALNCTAVRLELTDAKFVSIQTQKQGHEVIEHNYNLSQWFSFYQRQDGVIRLAWLMLVDYLRL